MHRWSANSSNVGIQFVQCKGFCSLKVDLTRQDSNIDIDNMDKVLSLQGVYLRKLKKCNRSFDHTQHIQKHVGELSLNLCILYDNLSLFDTFLCRYFEIQMQKQKPS